MYIKALSTISLSMALAGCSLAPKVDQSDVENWQGNSQLQMVESSDDTIVWKKYATPISRNHDKKVFLQKLDTTSLAKNDSGEGELDADINRLLVRFHAQLQKEFLSAGYQLVNRPVPGALSLKVAVTDIKRSPRDPSVTEYIPIGMLIGLSLHAAGVRDETLYVFFETDVTDSKSGEPLGRALTRVRGNDIEQSEVASVEDIYPAIDTQARQIRERMDIEFQK